MFNRSKKLTKIGSPIIVVSLINELIIHPNFVSFEYEYRQK